MQMRRWALGMAAGAVGLAAGGAFAYPLPAAWQLKFNNVEQLVPPSVVWSPTGGPVQVFRGLADGVEDNWGIAQITSIVDRATNRVVWSAGELGEHLTLSFWGLEAYQVTAIDSDENGTPDKFKVHVRAAATTPEGFAVPDLTGDGQPDAGVAIWLDRDGVGFTPYATAAGPRVRTGATTYPGVTDGELQGLFAFRPGVVPSDAAALTLIDADTLTAPLTGTGSGYVDAVPGSGPFADQSNKDGFSTPFGARDIFLSFNYRDHPDPGLPDEGWSVNSEDPAFGTAAPLLGRLGDRVWEDGNGNGVQDAGELGIPGVTVNLLDCAGNVLATTTTNADGLYEFAGLAAGSYAVAFVAPAGYVFTSPDQGGDDQQDSDAAPGTGAAPCSPLAAGATDLSRDAGLFRPASLGDRVWGDTDMDGIQDGGEVGFPGVTVNLLTCGDTLRATTTTAADGFYQFTGLAPGCYRVEFVAPQGQVLSPQDQGADDGADSDAASNGKTADIDLASGQSDPTWDAGLHVPAAPAIDIMKFTNGEDANDPTGPLVLPGETVTWSYEVRNTGNVPLKDVVVTDDRGVTVTCPATELEVGDLMTCYATGSATAGQYANVGTVTGMPKYGSTEQVTDSDPSHYYGAQPGIDIEKLTNGQDADEPTGPYVAVGAAVGWQYVVTNTGDVALNGVAVTDDHGVVVTCPKTTLLPGESMTCTGSGTAVAGQYGNLGCAEGTWATDRTVEDCDPSHYYGSGPAIDIEKLTNGEDADAAPGPFVSVGGEVTWTYVVTNTGNVALANVVVTDDRLGSVCTVASLAVGAQATCTVTGTATAGQYENFGTVVGTAPNGEDVTDTDPSHYFGSDVSIDLEKATNGEDADLPTGPEVPVGGPVTWTYRVENTGNVPLVNVVVTDDKLGSVCTIGALAVGGTATCTKTGTAVAGQYANMGYVRGTSAWDADVTVTDEDPSHYYGTSAGPGTGTPGFWKNHPEAWPVDTIVIGGREYTKAEAIRIMQMPDGDKTYTMFRALVAAKLNVLAGNESSCIDSTIAAADAWMVAYGPAGSRVKGNSAAWGVGEPLYLRLDAYNNGLLCAPHRD